MEVHEGADWRRYYSGFLLSPPDLPTGDTGKVLALPAIAGVPEFPE